MGQMVRTNKAVQSTLITFIWHKMNTNLHLRVSDIMFLANYQLWQEILLSASNGKKSKINVGTGEKGIF
jgi:hypothetical protein